VILTPEIGRYRVLPPRGEGVALNPNNDDDGDGNDDNDDDGDGNDDNHNDDDDNHNDDDDNHNDDDKNDVYLNRLVKLMCKI
jgi:hypothetical protein